MKESSIDRNTRKDKYIFKNMDKKDCQWSGIKKNFTDRLSLVDASSLKNNFNEEIYWKL